MCWAAWKGFFMKVPRSQRGFTLLEMMVALAIAAAIATMAYQALDSASRGAERSREVMDGINRLDRTWQILAADLRHIVEPVPTGLQNQFVADPFGGISQDERIMLFTRHSWLNPMERLRSDLQEVSYRLEDEVLWRDYRPVRNQPFDPYVFEEQALRQRLLEGVKRIDMRFLSNALLARSGRGALDGDDYLRDWAEAWPDPDQVGANPAELPLAILVRIEVEGVGVSERLFEITQFE